MERDGECDGAEEAANQASRTPGEDVVDPVSGQQQQQQRLQREQDRPRLQRHPSASGVIDVEIERLTRSMSAPATIRPGPLQTFVAGLVSDVEEYVRRGGYTSSFDEPSESGNDPDSSIRDYESLERRGSDQNDAHQRAGWGWLKGSGQTRRRERRRFWQPMNRQEVGVEESAKDMHSALLSDASPRSSEDDLPVNDRPQELRLLRARSFSSSQYGGNSVGRTVITFMKAMVGSYALYLPRMFAEGGMLFSVATVVVVGVCSTYNMLLLLRCRDMLARRGIMACSYGEVGYAALGRAGRICVDVSLFLSQIGYCVVYFIFVAENLGPLLERAFSPHPPWLFGTVALILAQACVQVPLSLVRKLEYLGVGMLVANVCVFSGLVVILVEVANKLVEDGVAGERTGGSITLINPGDCLILLGSVVGCFEGIGLVLPIEDAMDLGMRDRLPAALSWSMAGITAFFIAIGSMGYLAYGREVQHFITMDLPEGTPVATTVRIAYSLGLVLTSPLQLFPAIRVAERLLWPDAANGRKKRMPDYRRKWLKNILRACLVGITAAIALVAGNRFDSFTGIVGGVCAVPLALVYPPVFHLSLSGKAGSRGELCLHRGLLIFGVFAGAASTFVAIAAL